MTPIAAVQAHELRKSYPTPGGGSIEILHGVTCAIEAGGMTALVGPSGSGKSTALLCLAGLEPVSSGRVVLMGRDLGALPAARVAELYRDRVGFVFQAYNLVPYLTVRENVTICDTLAGRRPDRARAQQVLAGLGLQERADAVTATLSGGEQQRVALGRVLYRRPSVVFADEPTGNLDSVTSAVIEDLLFEYQKQHGATLIIVTHDEDLAKRCERIIRIKDGRVESDSAIEDAIRIAQGKMVASGAHRHAATVTIAAAAPLPEPKKPRRQTKQSRTTKATKKEAKK